ncbi:MAG: peptidylprolyl isomerase [Candidatus Woesearchaeota archaeon]
MSKENKLKKQNWKDKLEITAIISFLIIAFLVTGWIKMNDNQCDEFSKTIVEINTNKGKITAEIYNEYVPITATNFLNLVENKFYDNLTFHRYEPNFVIQGGDPRGDGTGGSNATIPLEINENLRHDVGMLAMARSSNPNSASSQFYITLNQAHFLDDNYAVFGKVIEGMDIVLKLRAKDKIESIKIIKKICK